MLDYVGACRAGLAGRVAARRIASAEELAAALEAWRLYTAPYPLRWQALWPLTGIALAQNRLAEASDCARQLCEPNQQVLPATLEDPLMAALAAWDAGQPDEARTFLSRALDLAQQLHFS